MFAPSEAYFPHQAFHPAAGFGGAARGEIPVAFMPERAIGNDPVYDFGIHRFLLIPSHDYVQKKTSG